MLAVDARPGLAKMMSAAVAMAAAAPPSLLAAERGSGGASRRRVAQVMKSTIAEQQRRPKRIVISTGDVSGDTHGAALAKELQRLSRTPRKKSDAKGGGEQDDQHRHLCCDVSISAIGGPLLAATGAEMLGRDSDSDGDGDGDGDTSVVSSIGVWEALPFVGRALRIQRRAKEQISRLRPDAIVLIDYPGVNIPLGSWAKTHLQPAPCVIYYIPPNEWLVYDARSRELANTCDLMLCVYKEEREHFQSFGANTVVIGHPLDASIRNRISGWSKERARAEIMNSFKKPGTLDTPLICAIPASRRQEIEFVAPSIFEACALIRKSQPGMRIVIPVASPYLKEPLAAAARRVLGEESFILWEGESAIAMMASDIAITKTGSASMELAFLEDGAVPEDIAFSALKYLTDSLERSRAIESFRRFREMVGNPHAPAEAAAYILELVTAEKQ